MPSPCEGVLRDKRKVARTTVAQRRENGLKTELHQETSTPVERAPRVVLTLLIAGLGGLLFQILGVPAPWLSGPATLVAILVVTGFRIDIPTFLRHAALMFLGVLMGSSVTPETFGQLARSPLTVAGLLICIVVIIAAIQAYLRLVHRYDPVTAQLSAVPGALPFVLAMAEESGADVRRVAIIQMIRLVALLVFLPSVFALFGYVGDVAESPVAKRPLIYWDVAVLVVAAVAGAVLLEWLRMPAGVMFGSMIAGALLFATGAVTTSLPEWMMLPGFAVIGATVGANFQDTDRRLLLTTLAAGIGSVFVGATASMLTALPFSYLTGLPLAQLWLAYAPGGVDAMAVLALAIGLEPAFVATHHLARFFALAVCLPIWLRPRIKAERSKSG